MDCLQGQTKQAYFMHTPGSVHSLLFHPLPLEFPCTQFATLWYRMSLMGPKQSHYLSAQEILFMQYALKLKTKKETVSVHQVFEEKVSLNFIYPFQSSDTITIVPLSYYRKAPWVYFIFHQNLAILLSTFQHWKLPCMKSKVSSISPLVLWMHCSSKKKKTLLVLLFCASYSCRCCLTAQ